MTQDEQSTNDPQLNYIAESLQALHEKRYSDSLRLLERGLSGHRSSSAPLDARALAKRLSVLVSYLEYRLGEDFGIYKEGIIEAEESQPERRCSFCGKPQSDERELIAGPEAYICEECIKHCSSALARQ